MFTYPQPCPDLITFEDDMTLNDTTVPLSARTVPPTAAMRSVVFDAMASHRTATRTAMTGHAYGQECIAAGIADVAERIGDWTTSDIALAAARWMNAGQNDSDRFSVNVLDRGDGALVTHITGGATWHYVVSSLIPKLSTDRDTVTVTVVSPDHSTEHATEWL